MMPEMRIFQKKIRGAEGAAENFFWDPPIFGRFTLKSGDHFFLYIPFFLYIQKKASQIEQIEQIDRQIDR